VGQSRAHIADLKRAVEENDDFAGEAREQRRRLASLGLMRLSPDTSQAAQCPVCESPVASANTTVATIMHDLERLDGDLQVIGSDTPALQRQMALEEEQLQQLRAALSRSQDEINEISAGLRALQQEPDQAERAAHVRGRISLYLDTTAQHVSAPQVEDRRDGLQQQIAELEELGTTWATTSPRC
jgi:chromosome segregation ATPase